MNAINLFIPSLPQKQIMNTKRLQLLLPSRVAPALFSSKPEKTSFHHVHSVDSSLKAQLRRDYQDPPEMQSTFSSSLGIHQKTRQDQRPIKDVLPVNGEDNLPNIFNTDLNKLGYNGIPPPNQNHPIFFNHENKTRHKLRLLSHLVDEPNKEMDNSDYCSGDRHLCDQHQPNSNACSSANTDLPPIYKSCDIRSDVCDANRDILCKYGGNTSEKGGLLRKLFTITADLGIDDSTGTKNCNFNHNSSVSGCSGQSLNNSCSMNTSSNGKVQIDLSGNNNMRCRSIEEKPSFSGVNSNLWKEKEGTVTEDLASFSRSFLPNSGVDFGCSSENDNSLSPPELQKNSFADLLIDSDETETAQSNKSHSRRRKDSIDQNNALNEDKVSSKKTEYNKKWGVKVFKGWCRKAGHKDDFENLETGELNKLLEEFWTTIRKSNAESFSKSSLLNLRAMLNSYLKGPPHYVTFDIVTDDRFGTSNEAHQEAKRYLESLGKEIEHKYPLNVKDIQQLYISGTLSNDNPTSLLRKVWFEITLHFCHKGSKKHYKLKKDTFEVRIDPNTGLPYVARKDSAIHNEDVRMIGTHTKLDPITSFQLYIQKLHPEQDRLFQQPRKRVEINTEVWYGKSAIGEKTLQQMMSDICHSARLDTRYTNHCVKTTNIQTYLTAMSTKRMTNEGAQSYYPNSKRLAGDYLLDDTFTLHQSEEFGISPPSVHNQTNMSPQSLCSQQLPVSCEEAINFHNYSVKWRKDYTCTRESFNELENYQVAQNKSSFDNENLRTPYNGLMGSSTQNYISSSSAYSLPDYTASIGSFKQPMEKPLNNQLPHLSVNSLPHRRNFHDFNLLSAVESNHQLPPVNSIVPFDYKHHSTDNFSSNPINASDNSMSHFAESMSEIQVAGQIESISTASRFPLQHNGPQNLNVSFNDVSNGSLQGNGASLGNLSQNEMSYINQQSNEMQHHFIQKNGADQYQIQARSSPVMPTTGSFSPTTTAQIASPYNTVNINSAGFLSPP